MNKDTLNPRLVASLNRLTRLLKLKASLEKLKEARKNPEKNPDLVKAIKKEIRDEIYRNTPQKK